MVVESWIFILLDSCWNIILRNCFVSDEITVCTENISSWFWAVCSLLELWLFLHICPFHLHPCWCLSSTPVPLKLLPPTVKMATRHLHGRLGVEIFVIPRSIVWGWPGCLHFTQCMLRTSFLYSAQGTFLHFLYMKRQILAPGYSTWLMEVSQVGWISACVDWRVILALQDLKFSFLASFLFLQSSHHLNK